MPDISKPMKFDVMWCPECGGDPIGTVETVEALAKLDVQGEGFVHSGFADIWWDTQKTQEDDGGRMTNRIVPTRPDGSWLCGICGHWSPKRNRSRCARCGAVMGMGHPTKEG